MCFQRFKQELENQQRSVRAEMVSETKSSRRFKSSRNPDNYLPKTLQPGMKLKPKPNPKPKPGKSKVASPLAEAGVAELSHGKLKVMQGDITEADTDAIVNGTDANLGMSKAATFY